MNHDRHLAAWFGVVGMGGVLHTINPRLFDDQLAYIATHAEDRVLLYDAAFQPLVDRMKPRWPTIEHYICFDTDFDGWLAAEDGDYAWHEGDERDPCGLCYTSGTTGNPKGVLYEHRSTVLHAMSVIAPDVVRPVGALGDAPGRADVPRQQLVHALCGAIARLKAGDLRRQPARTSVQAVQRGGGHPHRWRSDGVARR